LEEWGCDAEYLYSQISAVKYEDELYRRVG
jgi:hypothetical protein